MKNAVYNIIVTLLVFLFMYTGASKLLDYPGFHTDLSRQALPKNWVSFLAIALPSSEVITAALLCIRKTQYLGIICSVVLMTCFTIYAVLVITGTFEKRPCSCGGMLKHMTWMQHTIFNLFFLAAAIAALILFTRKPGVAENLTTE